MKMSADSVTLRFSSGTNIVATIANFGGGKIIGKYRVTPGSAATLQKESEGSGYFEVRLPIVEVEPEVLKRLGFTTSDIQRVKRARDDTLLDGSNTGMWVAMRDDVVAKKLNGSKIEDLTITPAVSNLGTLFLVVYHELEQIVAVASAGGSDNGRQFVKLLQKGLHWASLARVDKEDTRKELGEVGTVLMRFAFFGDGNDNGIAITMAHYLDKSRYVSCFLQEDQADKLLRIINEQYVVTQERARQTALEEIRSRPK